MKKDYAKPKAVIQNMTVNSFVAGACTDAGAIELNSTEDTCMYTDPDSYVTYFSQNCADAAEPGSEEWFANIVNPNPQSPFAQLCYHRPLDELSFFNS